MAAPKKTIETTIEPVSVEFAQADAVPAEPNPVEPAPREPYRLRKASILDLKGKGYLDWKGLLEYAHNYVDPEGNFNPVRSIVATIIQYPTAENNNTAICSATVTMMDGKTYTDVADANAKNVPTMVAPHFIRMASTRAKGRALRDAVNVGEALDEEKATQLTNGDVVAVRSNPSPVNPVAHVQAILTGSDRERASRVTDYIKSNYEGQLGTYGDIKNVPASILEEALRA